MNIHSTAIVSPKAHLDDGVEIAPYAVIGDGVRLGKGVQVGRFCVIENKTTIGAGCRIFTGAVIGSIPQDLKYTGGEMSIEIGEKNVIREYVTINLSTSPDRATVIGSNNVIMAYGHVAHDCLVGNHCIIANAGTLAGHVTLEDRVVVGGLVAIHQFVRVGTMAIIGGCSKVVSDIPPYAICDGHPARFYGLNLIGLKRGGVEEPVAQNLRSLYKIFFKSGLSKKHALDEIRRAIPSSDEVKHAIEFLSTSQRGLCH